MKNNTNTEQFLIMPYKLLSSAGYVSKDGECIKMNLTEKIIYAHIRNRFEFFKGLGKEYYDTQQSIAAVCNMDIKSVGNVLRKFIKDDLTTIYKKPYGNFIKNVYVNVPSLHLWYKDKPVSIDDVDDFKVEFVEDMRDISYQPEQEFDVGMLDLSDWKY